VSCKSPDSSGTDDGQDDFQSLLRKARAGDAQACRRIYCAYDPHLLKVVQRRLSKGLRGLYDAADFTQEVWKLFFSRSLTQRGFESPGRLVHFLDGVAQHLLQKAHRDQFQTQKRARFREVSLETCWNCVRHYADTRPGPFVSSLQQF
jgi:hypothetical protein